MGSIRKGGGEAVGSACSCVRAEALEEISDSQPHLVISLDEFVGGEH